MHAEGLDDHDATSLRVSDAMLATFNLTAHDVCPFWNDTLRPRLDAFRAEAETPPTGRPSLTSPKEYYEDKGYKLQDVAFVIIGAGLANAIALVALSTPLTLWNTIVGIMSFKPLLPLLAPVVVSTSPKLLLGLARRNKRTADEPQKGIAAGGPREARGLLRTFPASLCEGDLREGLGLSQRSPGIGVR